ncbi:MAG: DegV family protein, partial [Mycobacterium sp.]|nr:DegV family protein [Mycobacterium sp.]
MAVVVVTDSSARLDPDDLQRWNIRVVPLHVLQDGADYRDGVDPIPLDIQDRSHVSTSGAAPADLTDVYRKALADSGGDGVVAVHLSGGLSSTVSAAAAVGRELGPAVRVINSRSAAMGVGFVALAAARVAASGADLDAVEAQARSESSRQHGFIVVHRLDNLR